MFRLLFRGRRRLAAALLVLAPAFAGTRLVRSRRGGVRDGDGHGVEDVADEIAVPVQAQGEFATGLRDSIDAGQKVVVVSRGRGSFSKVFG